MLKSLLNDLISTLICCSETSSVSNSSDGGLYTNDEGRQGTSLKSLVSLIIELDSGGVCFFILCGCKGEL